MNTNTRTPPERLALTVGVVTVLAKGGITRFGEEGEWYRQRKCYSTHCCNCVSTAFLPFVSEASSIVEAHQHYQAP